MTDKLITLPDFTGTLAYLNGFEQGDRVKDYARAAVLADRALNATAQGMVPDLDGKSTAAYRQYIESMKRDECLGWEHKVKTGRFGEAELKAHCKAAEYLGMHRAYSDAVNLLAAAPSPSQEVGEASRQEVEVPAGILHVEEPKGERTQLRRYEPIRMLPEGEYKLYLAAPSVLPAQEVAEPVISIAKLEELMALTKPNEVNCYEGRGLHDEAGLIANWHACRDALRDVFRELQDLRNEMQDTESAPSPQDTPSKAAAATVCEPGASAVDVLRAFDRELARVWGKSDQPYAEAYGWVRLAWQAILSAPPAQVPAEASERTVPWPLIDSYAGGAASGGFAAWLRVRLGDGPEPTEFVRKDLVAAFPLEVNTGEQSERVKRYFANQIGSPLHPSTLELVVEFVFALGRKLAAAERKYGYSDGWKGSDWEDECRASLHEHIAKGDPRDVAAYCAFMWFHDWSTAAPPSPTPLPQAEAGKVAE
jgi:hypothetical protein